jgi:hypothetical protein
MLRSAFVRPESERATTTTLRLEIGILGETLQDLE